MTQQLFNEVEYMLVLKTNTFIIPYLQQLGTYCTGRTVKNFDFKNLWLYNAPDCHIYELDYWEKNKPLTEIEDYQLKPQLRTPFIPLVNLKFCSDGFGTIFQNEEDDWKIRGIRNASIEAFYMSRISKLKKKGKRQNKHTINFYKRIKAAKQQAPLERHLAYTDMGILLRKPLSDEDEDNVVMRARIFADEHDFKILGCDTKKFNETFVAGLV